MGILNFEKLPVSTLVGADSKTLKDVFEGIEREKGYRGKIRTTKCVQKILAPFYNINTRRYNALPEETNPTSPVFIIGHWRSGTTYVHNIFTHDPQFGYCTTYQTVFPHLMLWGRSFFRGAVKLFIPNERATDKMELGVDIPQEEEVALSNMTAISHYHFLSFPQRMEEYRERCLLLNGLTPEEHEEFKAAMHKLVRTSLLTQNKSVFLSKNPPHTARIKTLLEMWPDAKFIYLVRNPYTVFESTRNFFGKTINSTTLQHFDRDGYELEVLKTYKALYDRYEEQKVLIPEGHLYEIRFEDIETDPVATTEDIYRKLNIGNFDDVSQKIKEYVGSKRNFKKNKYNYDPHTVEVVEKWCIDALHKWDYHL